MKQELKLRIVSRSDSRHIVLAATWYGGLIFRLLAAAIALLIYYEWSTITGSARDPVTNVLGWVGEVLVAVARSRRGLRICARNAGRPDRGRLAMIFAARASRWFAPGLFYAAARARACGDPRR